FAQCLCVAHGDVHEEVSITGQEVDVAGCRERLEFTLEPAKTATGMGLESDRDKGFEMEAQGLRIDLSAETDDRSRVHQCPHPLMACRLGNAHPARKFGIGD